MSEAHRKNIRKNTRELWTLIEKRDISADISEEFKDLVKSGVDVNLPDANEDNNTAIHFVVAKNDRKCIEFLLTLDPDLGKRNSEGLTPEELARNSKHDEIVQLLKSHRAKEKLNYNANKNVDTLSQSDKQSMSPESSEFIKSINLGSDSFEATEANGTIRILKVFASPDECLITLEGLQDFLSNSVNLIAVIIETKETFQTLDALKDVFKCHGSLIVRFSDQGDTFIKECSEEKLTKLVNAEIRSLIYRKHMEELRDKLQETDEDGDNLLMLEALKKNEIKILKLLLELGIDVSHSRQYSDVANELDDSDCLHQLLLNDSPFPGKFDYESSSLEIKTLVDGRNNFFKAISSGSEDEVRKYNTNNKTLRVIYNLENKSALTMAIERKEFRIYAMFVAQGFAQGIDESFSNTRSNLTSDELAKIRESTSKFFRSSEYSHILHIMSKTKVLCDSSGREELMKVARNLLEIINEDESGKILLEFLGQLDKLEIIIDFNRRHVQGLDPMQSKAARGATYHSLGYILIGAKGYESEENLADIAVVMAHEFLHYILQVVYQNNSNPYRQDDERTKKLFAGTIAKFNEFRHKNELDEVLKSVFTAYKDHLWTIELIVRVVQLKMKYKNNTQHLNELLKIECIQELFEFYYKVTQPDILSRIDTIKLTLAVKEINELDGLVRRIQESKIRVKDSKIDALKISENDCKIIASNSPKLTLINIYQLLRRNFESQADFSNIFIKKDMLYSQDILSKIVNLRKINTERFLVVDCTENRLTKEFIKCIAETFDTLKNTVFVTKEENLTLITNHFKHVWDDLSEDSKNFVLSKKLQFQNHLVVHKEFIDEEMTKELNLNNLLFGSLEFRSGTKNCEEEIYIERKFSFKISSKGSEKVEFSKSNKVTSEKQKLILMNPIEFIKHVEKLKIAIVSDIAGVGKTTTIRRLTESYKTIKPFKWVEFLDLKDHVESFKNFKSQHFNDFCDFLCVTMMKCENKSDQKLFENLYSRGQVVLLLDGFDEISPNYKDLLLTHFKTFNKEIGNVLIITTRQHLREDLEAIFDRISCDLSPFDFEDQVKFLVEHSKLKGEQKEIDEKTARKLVETFNETIFEDSEEETIIGVPLLTRMFVEAQLDQGPVELNLFSFFKDYFSQMIKIWNKEKGEIAGGESLKVLEESDIQSPLDVHRQIALDYFFGSCYPGRFQFNEDEWTDEKISRIGFITMTNGKPKFNHETVAEFFVSDFLVTHVEKRKLTEDISKILFSVLSEWRFRTVRMFLDQGLKNFENLLRILINEFKPFETEDENVNMFANSLEEDNETLLLAMLERSAKNESLFEIIMGIKSETNIDENHMRLNQLLGCHFMNLAASKTSSLILSNLSLYVTDLQNDEDDNNIFHFAARNHHEGVFGEILKLVSKKKNPENVRKMLIQRNEDDDDPLRILVKYNKISKRLIEFLNILKSEFSTNKDELMDHLCKELNVTNRTSFSLVFRYNDPYLVEVYWRFIEDVLKPEDLKKILLVRNLIGRNCLQASTLYSSAEVLKKSSGNL